MTVQYFPNIIYSSTLSMCHQVHMHINTCIGENTLLRLPVWILFVGMVITHVKSELVPFLSAKNQNHKDVNYCVQFVILFLPEIKHHTSYSDYNSNQEQQRQHCHNRYNDSQWWSCSCHLTRVTINSRRA